jgi:divalent metal cation (Fe/Co/Zn/Cd) transporter
VQKVGQEYHVSLHCTFESQANLNEVHESMARLERRLRAEIPALGHVVIHPEPSEERLFTGG